jgi:two-component system, cell cycle response regulator DivK
MPSTAGRLVLLAEDNPDNRDVYALFLLQEGWRVETAVNGLEAVEKAATLLPDVIVMDLQMPLLDGWEACRRIRADPRAGHIPVVVLSSHAFPTDQARAIEAGCDAYYAKPLNPTDLLVALNKVVAGTP